MAFIELEKLPTIEIFPGFTGRCIHTGTMSFIYWTVQSGATAPAHSHLHEQIAQVLKGSFELTVDGETKILQPGIIAVIPPHALHSGKAITECELVDVFYPEREDYKF